MKNILGAVLCIFSMNIYSQTTSIETDPLYLQFEKEYANLSASNSLAKDADIKISDFNIKLGTDKNRAKFYKDKDKERWLKKNISKTSFPSVEQALEDLNAVVKLQNELALSRSEVDKLKEELIKKYSSELIWSTLKTRLAKK